ncbi:class D sortase [Acetatifactor muris]|uniref:class D sortase n=1 Tax=Acetatifactor muris TaxID=879566 RepID=UPI0023EF7AAD|nr:class D sortase [Acetatifactor muris]
MKYKIISIICMAAGLALLSVPLFFSLYGGMRNRELMEEVEKFGLEDMNAEEKVQEDKGQAWQTYPDETEKAVYQEGDVIGIIEIEALNLKYPVVEGVGSGQLDIGIGHIPDTAGFGEEGNCVLAGHRGSRYGTYFKYLNRINAGDEIRLTDKEGNVYFYEAVDMKVVDPYENSVKDQGTEKALTLLTCENSGTMRLIVTCVWKEAE